MGGVRGIFRVESWGVPLSQLPEEGIEVSQRDVGNMKDTVWDDTVTKPHNDTWVVF